jgi:hypothetical protein
MLLLLEPRLQLGVEPEPRDSTSHVEWRFFFGMVNDDEKRKSFYDEKHKFMSYLMEVGWLMQCSAVK